MSNNSNTQIAAAQPTALTIQNGLNDIVDMFLRQHDCSCESSRKLYGRALRQFFAWVERTGRNLQELTRADVIAFRDNILQGYTYTDANGTEVNEPAKSSLTAASYLTAVKLFYSWLHEENNLMTDIAAGVKLPKREKRYEREALTNAQAHTLIEQTAATANTRDTAIINLLLRCGLRTIEVVRADVGDIKTKGGAWVLYVQGKGHQHKDNFVILSDKCRSALSAYLQERGNPDSSAPLFTCDSNRNKDGRLTTRTISGIAKRHLQGIGLNSRSYTAHSLRHTAACSLLEATDNIHLVQMTLRHQSAATTSLYTYHIEERRRLKAAAEQKLDALF